MTPAGSVSVIIDISTFLQVEWYFTVPGTIGPVHLGLVAGDGTLTDLNDMFTVAVIY
jgi:hypothetical protein